MRRKKSRATPTELKMIEDPRTNERERKAHYKVYSSTSCLIELLNLFFLFSSNKDPQEHSSTSSPARGFGTTFYFVVLSAFYNRKLMKCVLWKLFLQNIFFTLKLICRNITQLSISSTRINRQHSVCFFSSQPSSSPLPSHLSVFCSPRPS